MLRRYLAPEVLLGEPYSYECDAWSLGTMLYEMLTGKGDCGTLSINLITNLGMTPFYADNQ